MQGYCWEGGRGGVYQSLNFYDAFFQYTKSTSSPWTWNWILTITPWEPLPLLAVLVAHFSHRLAKYRRNQNCPRWQFKQHCFNRQKIGDLGTFGGTSQPCDLLVKKLPTLLVMLTPFRPTLFFLIRTSKNGLRLSCSQIFDI